MNDVLDTAQQALLVPGGLATRNCPACSINSCSPAWAESYKAKVNVL